MAGKAAGDRIRAEGILEQNRRELEALTNEVGMDRAGLQRVFLTALGNGQIDEAKAISEVLKSLPNPAAAPKLDITEQVIMQDGKPIRVQTATDPTTGQIVSQRGLGEAPDQNIFERVETLSIDGRPMRVAYPKGGGQPVILGEAMSGGSQTAGDRTNMALSNVMLEAHNTLNTMDHLLAAPVQGFAARMGQGEGVTGLLARMATNPETQVAFSAALQFLNPTVRFLSGAQMTENEARRYQAALIPMPGDQDAVVERKRVARQVLIDSIQQGLLPDSKDAAYRWLSEQGLAMPAGADEWAEISSEQMPMPAYFQGPNGAPSNGDAGRFGDLTPGR
jgi:hypothetical protein